MIIVRRLPLVWCCLIVFSAMVMAASPVRLGMALPASGSSPASGMVTALATVRAAGAQRVIIPAYWPRIQPNASTWDFSWLDTVIAAAAERQLEVVLVLGPAPRWSVSYLGANPSASEIRRARPDLAAYRTYATRIAQRYANRVKYYQLWEHPTSLALLALPQDVSAMYREGAKAIHTVDRTLQVIAPEPGDLQLNWIYEYTRGMLWTSRPNIIALAPTRETMTPQELAWRIQVLRERVLPSQIALWVDLPMAATEKSTTLPLGAMALLQGIDGLTFMPDGNSPPGVLSTEPTTQSVAFFAQLQGLTFAGWHAVTPDVTAGLFRDTVQSRALLLPLADAGLTIHPSDQSADGITATAETVVVTHPAASPISLPVTGVTQLPVTALQPLILGNVSLAMQSGTPGYHPDAITTPSVSLDIAGTDPMGIHALRNLPGGRYGVLQVNGQTVLATLRDVEPWIHFDIPDGFLFFNTARVPIDVSVQVYGVKTVQKSGFNLYYEAVGGMRSTPWRWIDVGTEKVYTYTFRLTDAILAGDEGYDMRLNMGGSDDNIRVLNVTVKKVVASHK